MVSRLTGSPADDQHGGLSGVRTPDCPGPTCFVPVSNSVGQRRDASTALERRESDVSNHVVPGEYVTRPQRRDPIRARGG